MSRRKLTFACHGSTLGATLDEAPGSTGMLLVSGGNEIRAGAFNGQAALAAELAAAGHPVFRFDRRGTGDSEGDNREFRNLGSDLNDALQAFRESCPGLIRVVGFGNCDAASALMLAQGAGCDALVLSNPWTIEASGEDAPEQAPLPASAVRARYAERLKNPREVWRLLSGRVDLGKLARGLAMAAKPKASPSTLSGEMQAGLARFAGPVTILLAEADRTAQVFAENWDAADPRIARCPRAGHAYAEPHARQWLRERLLEALSG